MTIRNVFSMEELRILSTLQQGVGLSFQFSFVENLISSRDAVLSTTCHPNIAWDNRLIKVHHLLYHRLPIVLLTLMHYRGNVHPCHLHIPG